MQGAGEYNTKLLTTLGSRDVIGELSLLYGERRSATVITHEESLLIVLEKTDFDSIIKVKSIRLSPL